MATYNEKEDCFGLPIKSRVDLAGSVTYYDYFGYTRRSFTLQIKHISLPFFLSMFTDGWLDQTHCTRRRGDAELLKQRDLIALQCFALDGRNNVI